MSELEIQRISCKVMEEGELIEVDRFLVSDDTGKSIDGILHATNEAAELVVTAFAKLAVGLEYARMRFPGIAEKSQRAKANVIVDYMLWIEAGKPLSEIKEKKVVASPMIEMPIPPEEGTEGEEGESFE